MARTAYLCLLFFLLHCFVLVVSYNPLDIGAIRSCVRYQGSICDIDYFIPESVANLTAIKDAFIEGIINQNEAANNEECSHRLCKLLCAEEYPQCVEEEDKVNVILPETCTQFLNTCSGVEEHFCDFATVNLTLGQCKTIETLTAENNHSFKKCDRLETWTSDYITEWMFNYLKRVDEDVEITLQNIPMSEECQLKYIEFKCSSLGRCWDDGNRIELTTNKTDCLFIRNYCLSSSQKNFLKPELDCDSWPDDIQLATIPTALTDPPPPFSETTSPTSPTSTTSTSPSSIQFISLPTNTPITTIPSSTTIRHISSLLIILLVVLSLYHNFC